MRPNILAVANARALVLLALVPITMATMNTPMHVSVPCQVADAGCTTSQRGLAFAMFHQSCIVSAHAGGHSSMQNGPIIQSRTCRDKRARWTCTAQQHASVNHVGVMERVRPAIAEHRGRSSRRPFASALAWTMMSGLFVLGPQPVAAMTVRELKRALVNIVRVREGVSLLQGRLEDNMLSGFQDGVKLLVSDTNLRENVKLACAGLAELNLGSSSVKVAEDKADRIVNFISQVVEYDGWDKMNRMDIREKFQEMTPQKIAFAKRGLNEVRKEIANLLSLFPPDLVKECEELYKDMYAVDLSDYPV